MTTTFEYSLNPNQNDAVSDTASAKLNVGLKYGPSFADTVAP